MMTPEEKKQMKEMQAMMKKMMATMDKMCEGDFDEAFDKGAAAIMKGKMGGEHG